MKRFLLLIAVAAMVLSGCQKIYNDLDKLDDRLDRIEQTTLPSIEKQIESINSQLVSLKAIDEAIKAQIADLQKGGGEGVPSEEIDNLKAKDKALEEAIAYLQRYVDEEIKKAKDAAAAAYATIEQYNNIVTQLSGLQTATEQLGEELIGKINDEVKKLNDKIAELETRLQAVEESVKQLIARIQSVSYIPKYSDGYATVEYDSNTSLVVLDFKVSPKECVSELAQVWSSAVSCEAIYTQSRAVSFVAMPITKFEANAANGVISVTASGENLSDDFFAGTKEARVALVISDGNNSVTSEYIPMVAKSNLNSVPNDEIWYTSSDGKIVTPYKTDVYSASIISNTYENNKGIIKFDGPLTVIGELAFLNCQTLTSITIPNSVVEIGEGTFSNCSNLATFHSRFASADKRFLIIDGVLIGFAGAANAIPYTIPNGVTRIGGRAFYGCTKSPTKLTIPDSVTEIGPYAFVRCEPLTSITIGNGVTKIEEKAFGGNPNLKTIYSKFASEDNRCLIIDGELVGFAPSGLGSYTLPSSITKIRSQVFLECSSLTNLTIPNSVTEIGESAFSGSTSIRSVVLPESITKIDQRTFYNCANLKSVTIPEGITEIGNYAFYNCTNLTSITVPDSVTSIGEAAFRKCQALESVKLSENLTTITVWMLAETKIATNVLGYDVFTIPDSVTKIEYYAFESCPILFKLVIPKNVRSIGQIYSTSSSSSFSKIQYIECRPTTPPEISSSTIPASVTDIVVPKASYDKYKAATGWSKFASKIRASSSF